jgi:hypothetical protein
LAKVQADSGEQHHISKETEQGGQRLVEREIRLLWPLGRLPSRAILAQDPQGQLEFFRHISCQIPYGIKTASLSLYLSIYLYLSLSLSLTVLALFSSSLLRNLMQETSKRWRRREKSTIQTLGRSSRSKTGCVKLLRLKQGSTLTIPLLIGRHPHTAHI